MIDESMDTEQMKQPVQPWEFRAKPAWQRLLIMVGGVVMNFVLAVCIYIGISYTWGDNYIASKDVKYGYVFNDVAKEIGLRDGDKIIDVAGEPVEDCARILQTMIFDQAPSPSNATVRPCVSTFPKRLRPRYWIPKTSWISAYPS